MNKVKCKYLSLFAIVGFAAALLCGPSPALAQVAFAPNLNTAHPYSVLGTNSTPIVGTVTCSDTGPGIGITSGSVGTTFTSITNSCTIAGPIDAPVNPQVVTDFNAAFAAVDTLNPVCTGVIPIITTNVLPGVYCSAAGTTIGAGVILTLNGNASDVWVFRVGTTLGALTLTNAQVVLGGTAQACNVFWKTSQAATLTDSIFNGTVLSGDAVTMTRGSWTGRAMATTDVTLTDPSPMAFPAGCAALVAPTLSKAFLPNPVNVGGVSTLTLTLSNANATAATLTALFTDTLPGGVVIAGTPNASTTCGGTAVVGAPAGGNQVTLSSGSTIPAGAPGSCTVKVDVTAAVQGQYNNTLPAGTLVTNTGSSGEFNQTLVVQPQNGTTTTTTTTTSTTTTTVPGGGGTTTTTPPKIPTAGNWGMVMLGLAFMGALAWMLRARRSLR